MASFPWNPNKSHPLAPALCHAHTIYLSQALPLLTHTYPPNNLATFSALPLYSTARSQRRALCTHASKYRVCDKALQGCKYSYLKYK